MISIGLGYAGRPILKPRIAMADDFEGSGTLLSTDPEAGGPYTGSLSMAKSGGEAWATVSSGALQYSDTAPNDWTITAQIKFAGVTMGGSSISFETNIQGDGRAMQIHYSYQGGDGNRVLYLWRRSVGGAQSFVAAIGSVVTTGAPTWFKITKLGGLYAISSSTDGVAYIQLTTATDSTPLTGGLMGYSVTADGPSGSYLPSSNTGWHLLDFKVLTNPNNN